MKKLVLSVFCLMLTACNTGSNYDIITVPGPAPDAVQQEINLYNAYRVASGQTPVTQGLSCRLATVPNGSSQIAGTTQTTQGSFTFNGSFNVANQSASNGLVGILPDSIVANYTQWYVVTCTGFMVFPDNNWHSFALTSDDGSILSINGSLVNNDGNHGAQTVTASKFYQQGVYSFTLQYMQGPAGSEALILQMDGSVISAENFVH